MTTYAEFVENNDCEGETWSFFIPIEGNEEELKTLAFFVEDSETYELRIDPSSVSIVEYLVSRDEGGYMSRYNRLEGKLILPETYDPEEGDVFYKGGIERYVQ